MSTPDELLARLTAGAVNPAACGGRSSSRERLIGTETAGALKGLSVESMDFSQAVYMGDELSRKNVLINTEKQVARMSERWKWKLSPKQVKELAEIAATEVMSPNRCASCGGVGHRYLVACKKCDGTGLKPITYAEIARKVEVKKQNFGNVWKDRVKVITEYVRALDSNVIRKISENTKEIDNYYF